MLVPMTTKANALLRKQVTVSIGLAAASDPGMDQADKLVYAADTALYAAKKLERNRVEPAP